MCVFARLERKIDEVVHIRELKKVLKEFKSLSLNFGGKLSKVLRVHNSKQITEETLINDIFFCLFQRRN